MRGADATRPDLGVCGLRLPEIVAKRDVTGVRAWGDDDNVDTPMR